jgi:hypothetical protein
MQASVTPNVPSQCLQSLPSLCWLRRSLPSVIGASHYTDIRLCWTLPSHQESNIWIYQLSRSCKSIGKAFRISYAAVLSCLVMSRASYSLHPDELLLHIALLKVDV